MSQNTWLKGNRVELLECGEEYFPRVFEAIANASSEVLVESYILVDDATGQELRTVLIAAAKRGVRVVLTIDGYGSADLAPEFIEVMAKAGVTVQVFDPQPKLLGLPTHLLYRLHRKLVLVDGRVAYLGGINFCHDHMRECGPDAKLDYSVEIAGPVVGDIERCMRRIVPTATEPAKPTKKPAASGKSKDGVKADALIAVRDNVLHRDDIERQYRLAVKVAKQEIIIANAYFFPGYRLLHALRRAARRGISVHLLLQGKGDVALAQWASTTLYEYILRSGIKIYEYREQQMHCKVATIDDAWATVGSSNLDPLSLYSNLEANIVLRNPEFAKQLRGRLVELIEKGSVEITRDQLPPRNGIRQAFDFLGLTLMRQLSNIARWLPAPKPLRSMIQSLTHAKPGAK